MSLKRPESFGPSPFTEENFKPIRKGLYNRETRREVVVREHPELQCTQYFFNRGNANDLEMFLSNEVAAEVRGLGWKKIRNSFEEDLAGIEQDPYGSKSIDPINFFPRSQRLRTVNILTGIESKAGVPVAVKGTGRGIPPNDAERENLLQQYEFMRKLQVDSLHLLSKEQQKVLRFLPVYGAISYPVACEKKYQEWLIMERVVRGSWVKNYSYGAESAPPVMRLKRSGLDPVGDRALIKAFNLDPNFATWHNFSEKLRGQGLIVNDLESRNLLSTEEGGNSRFYTIIDQRPK